DANDLGVKQVLFSDVPLPLPGSALREPTRSAGMLDLETFSYNENTIMSTYAPGVGVSPRSVPFTAGPPRLRSDGRSDPAEYRTSRPSSHSLCSYRLGPSVVLGRSGFRNT